MGTRRKARELALQMLFHIEFNRDDSDWRATFWKSHGVSLPIQEFADQLVDGVLGSQKEIDDIIEKNAQNWTLSRMTAVDRNVLRVGTFELKFNKTAPPSVVINEAIEVAKRFGDQTSGSFVNGILDQIINEGEGILARKGGTD